MYMPSKLCFHSYSEGNCCSSPYPHIDWYSSPSHNQQLILLQSLQQTHFIIPTLHPLAIFYHSPLTTSLPLLKCLDHTFIIYIISFFRRMYFKERQRSQLYKREQHLEQIRLNHKISQIKHRKLKINSSENYLPPITHRVSQIKPCQKAAIEMETERLKKRIFQLKSNKSEYFAKVVGINLSEWSKSKVNEGGEKGEQSLNKSCLKEELPFEKAESKTIDAQ